MKVSKYHCLLMLCKFRPILLQSQEVFSTTFIGYFCTLLICFHYYGFNFLSRFLLETKESSINLHDNQKGLDHNLLRVNFQWGRTGGRRGMGDGRRKGVKGDLYDDRKWERNSKRKAFIICDCLSSSQKKQTQKRFLTSI